MGNVVTKSTAITCAHQGTMTLKSTDKLTIQSVPALLAESDGTSLTCPNKDSATMCKQVISVTGASKKLTVGGRPLLITPVVITTNGTPSALAPTSPPSKLTTN
jgi:hypothetical protein